MRTFLLLLVLMGLSQAGNLGLPGFENAGLWKAEVQKVTKEKNRASLVNILEVGKSEKLDGMYSTNYAHYLRQVFLAQPALFLSVADEVYPKRVTHAFAYLINETEGYPLKVEDALKSVKKEEKEFVLAQEVLKWAQASRKENKK